MSWRAFSALMNLRRLCRLSLLLAALILSHAATVSASELVRELAAGHPRKVVVIGTSLTAGGAWVRLLREWLTTTYPGVLTLVNQGLSGKNSAAGVEHLAEILAQQPDTIFIEFGMNDAFQYKPPIIPLTVEEARANLLKIIDEIVAYNPQAEIILQTMNTVWDSPAGKNQSATLRPDLAAFYQMYRETAQARGLLLIDHEASWKALEASDVATYQKLIPDGTHPSPEGAKTVIFPLLQKRLMEEIK